MKMMLKVKIQTIIIVFKNIYIRKMSVR